MDKATKVKADKYIEKAKNLVLEIKAKRKAGNLTQEEMEEARLDISTLQFLISEEILLPAMDDQIYSELDAEDEFSKEFASNYRAYVEAREEDTGKLKYTKSSAESFARNTAKMKTKVIVVDDQRKRVKNPAYVAKGKAGEAKNYVSKLYQLLKAMGNVSNSMAPMSKRTI